LNKKGQASLSPQVIMSIIVSLIILAVGVYAFFVTTASIPTNVGNTTGVDDSWRSNATYQAVQNVSATGGNVFNVIGIVMVIGAILLIVGLVYSYVKPGGI
jgi:beta-lactamase regulating signal transducer with metallopeptidase domain